MKSIINIKELVMLCFFMAIFQVSFGEKKEQGQLEECYINLPFKMDVVIRPTFKNNIANIKDFGAKNDGVTLNTQAIAAAISNIESKGGGTVVIPEGLWLTGPIELKSNICLYTEKGAIVLFSKKYADYSMVKTWYEGQMMWRAQSPIYAKNAENFAICGEGLFDGGGDAWRPVNRVAVDEALWNKLIASGGVVNEAGTKWYPTAEALKGSVLSSKIGQLSEQECAEIKVYLRPVMLNFVSCNKVLLEGVTFQNSPAWCLHPLLSENITINKITVLNEEWASNGDALDLESCQNVLVSNSTFDAGDDAICMKSGKDEEGRKRGVPTQNVIVYNCKVFSGHGGFVVGSEMSGGVRNVLVSHCSFIGTDNGLRFKSTRGRGGIVENIYISNIYMANILRDAILYDLYYSLKSDKFEIQKVDESTPQFRNIHMENIVCKGADRAILFQGLPEMTLKNITLKNATIEARTGIFFNDAEQIQMKNVRVYTSVLPLIDVKNANNIIIDSLSSNIHTGFLFNITGAKTNQFEFINSNVKLENIKMGTDVRPGAVITN